MTLQAKLRPHCKKKPLTFTGRASWWHFPPAMRKTCSAFNYSDSQLLHTGKLHLIWGPEAALPLQPHKRRSRLCFSAGKGLPLLTPDSLRDKPHCEKTWAGGARFSLSVMLYQPQPCLHPAVTTETPRSAQTPTSLPEGSSLERLQKMPLRPLLLARTSLEAQPQSLPQTHSKVCSLTHGSTDLYSPQRHTARAGPISPRPGWP